MKDERLTLLPGCALRWPWIDATGESRPCVLQLERLHIVEPKVVSAASPRSCTEQANARDAAYWRRKVEKHSPVQYEELVHDLFSKELEKEVDLLDFRIFHNKQYLGKIRPPASDRCVGRIQNRRREDLNRDRTQTVYAQRWH